MFDEFAALTELIREFIAEGLLRRVRGQRDGLPRPAGGLCLPPDRMSERDFSGGRHFNRPAPRMTADRALICTQ
jgi:hypothetical protein